MRRPFFALDRSRTRAFSSPIKAHRQPELLAIVFLTAFAALPSHLTASDRAAPAKVWPHRYEAPAVRWEAGLSEQGYTYQTRHYIILSKSEIGEGRLEEMTKTAEAVRGVLSTFPIRLVPEDTAGAARGVGPWRGLHVIRIYPTQAEYRAAGGPPGSVGVYQPRTGEVAVSLERMIEPKGPRSNLEPRQRYRLLVHELVHQAMGERLGALPIWMIEGFAEYFAACQFAPGRYRFDTDTRAIIDHSRAIWLGPGERTMTLPRISIVQALTMRSWNADNATNPEASYAKYGAALLLVHYQLQRAIRGDRALATFLEAEPSYEPIEGRRGRYIEVPPPEAPLWTGRPPATIERALTKYWKGKGLDLRFTKNLKPEPPDPFD